MSVEAVQYEAVGLNAGIHLTSCASRFACLKWKKLLWVFASNSNYAGKKKKIITGFFVLIKLNFERTNTYFGILNFNRHKRPGLSIVKLYFSIFIIIKKNNYVLISISGNDPCYPINYFLSDYQLCTKRRVLLP